MYCSMLLNAIVNRFTAVVQSDNKSELFRGEQLPVGIEYKNKLLKNRLLIDSSCVFMVKSKWKKTIVETIDFVLKIKIYYIFNVFFFFCFLCKQFGYTCV